MIRCLFIYLIALIGISIPAHSKVQFGFQEKLGATVSDVKFMNSLGQEVQIANLIDKPTAFVFGYATCMDKCSKLMKGIAEIINRSDLVMGIDYQVIFVSVSPKETPFILKNYKAAYDSLLNKPQDAHFWHYLSGSKTQIDSLADALGVRYAFLDGNYTHPLGVVFVSPQKQVVHYIYNTYFLPPDWRIAVEYAWENKSRVSIPRKTKVCNTYESSAYANVNKMAVMAGIIILTAAIGFFLYLALGKRKA